MNSAQNTIARSVDESAVASYFEAVFANLATIRSGLVEAAGGADQLHDGLAPARSGAGDPATGAAGAAEGAERLSTGASTLAAGLGTARTGARDLASGLHALQSGSARLSTGAARVAAGNKALDDRGQPALAAAQEPLPGIEADATAVSGRLDTIAQRAAGRSSSISTDLGAASEQLAALQEQYPEVADSPALQRAQARLDAAAGRADAIAADVRTGAHRIGQVNAQVQAGGDLDGRIADARSDLEALDTGAAAVAAGARQLDGGITSASAGPTGSAPASAGRPTAPPRSPPEPTCWPTGSTRSAGAPATAARPGHAAGRRRHPRRPARRRGGPRSWAPPTRTKRCRCSPRRPT